MTTEVDLFAPTQYSKSAFGKDKAVGYTIEGTVTEVGQLQSKNLNTNEPEFWADGKPKMVAYVSLQTTLNEDENDEGVRTVWAGGGKARGPKGGRTQREAIAEAAKQAGSPIAIGGTLSVKFLEEVAHENRAYNAYKLFVAKYVPPAAKEADPFKQDDWQ